MTQPWDFVSDSDALTWKRDALGVEPFFYARVAGGLVHSRSLEAVLAHPQVRAEELDARAVGDYLATGVCGDAAATVYAGIRRVPPAHTLTWESGKLEISRHWNLPSPGPRRDAPAALEQALRAAIRERLTASSAVVFMSGGLDSTTLAALAREVAPEVALTAQTSVYRSRIADVEEPFAVEAARSLGIPLEVVPLDGFPPLQALDEGVWTADPGALLSAPAARAVHAIAARRAPVAMHGHPADAVLAPSLTSYLKSLDPVRRIGALIRYTLTRRRPPFFYVRDTIGWPRRVEQRRDLPAWLRAPVHESADGIHPLESPAWSSYFEWAHPTATGVPLEVVYPWADTRVIEAALALPAIPWLVDKHVARELLRGRISEPIRTRPKSFLGGDPWQMAAPDDGRANIEAATEFIDPERYGIAVRESGLLSDQTLRALAFEWWLRELPSRVAIIRARAVRKY